MKHDEALEILERLSQKYGADPLLVQGAGGNTSVKTDDGQMVVKASGFALKNVRVDKGWVKLPHNEVSHLVSAAKSSVELDSSVDDWLASSIDKVTTSPNPAYKASIEEAMHEVLGPIVVQIHPVAMNVLLCAENGRALCHEIFAGTPFLWIEPLPPGYYLARAIKDALAEAGSSSPRVIFLASHGVIVHGESESEINGIYDRILGLTTNWFKGRGVDAAKTLEVSGWEGEIAEADIFPDTVVFHALAKNLADVAPDKKQGIIETFAASREIRSLHKRAGLHSRVLDKRVCEYILGMSREKHRQAQAVKK